MEAVPIPVIPVPPALVPALQELTHRLAEGDFAALEAEQKLGEGGLTAALVDAALADFRQRLEAYQRSQDTRVPTPQHRCRLIDVPAEALALLEAIPFAGEDGWGVNVPLWWSDEDNGEFSDELTLVADVWQTPDGPTAAVSDIDVL